VSGEAPPARDPFATLTHARLRVRAGDPAGARRLVLELLEREPSHAAARELLALLDGAPARRHHEPESAPEEGPAHEAAAAELRAAFRAAMAPRSRQARRPMRRLLGLLGQRDDAAR
jgi:hypothetical protein